MMTRAEAVARLIEQDVARWGESERAASARLHAKLTRGRAINALANRAELSGDPDAAQLRAEADAALTASDRAELRRLARDG